jgi:phosphate uptake regulator
MYRIKEEIYKSYTDGYNIIKVIGANLENFSESVRKIFNNFVAVEIIEQTQGKIIAKDFLNIEDVNVKDIIRRIDIILRSMFSDSFECMKKLKSSVISKRDVDVNRLCFMLERLLRSAMDNTEISRKLKINGSELLRFWSIAINLEKIGDEIKRISRFFNNVDFNTKQKKELSEIFFEIEKLYLDVMKSYYKNDLNLAFDVNYRKDGLQNKCTLFFEKNRVDGLCEKMKSLISWIREISLVVCK